MPASTDIYGQIQPVRPRNMLADFANVAQIQGLQQNQQLGAMKMDELRRASQRQNRLDGLLGQEYDTPEARENALLRGGFMNEATKLGTDRRANKKADLDNETAQFKLANDRLTSFLNIVGSATDQRTYDIARQNASALGVDVSQAPAAFDPAFVQGIAQQAMTHKERLEAAARARGLDIQVRGQDVSAATARRGQDISASTARRGQDLVDARSRDQISASKAPAGYRWAGDGRSLEPIPGGPAVKSENASEGERKAATLLQRLEGSQQQLEAALKTNPDAAKPELLASGLRSMGAEAAANTITNTQRQQVEAAQLDMLDAALTLGTGAAYTREQIEGYRRSYFPQIGDDAATVADKQARLNNVIQAAKIAAGRAAKSTGGAGGNTGATTPPAGGALSPEEQKELEALRDRFGKGRK